MPPLFGHHISLRAIALAAFELLAFTIVYYISRAFILPIAAPEIGDDYGQAYLLPLFGAIALGTAFSCGLYNKEVVGSQSPMVSRLLTVSVLMYLLTVIAIFVVERVIERATSLTENYTVTLISAAGYFISALSARHWVISHKFNDRALLRRVLVLGTDDCAAKIDYLNGASRSPYTTVGFVPIGAAQHSVRLSQYKILPEHILETPLGLLKCAIEVHADEIVVASRERRGLPVAALMECKLHGIAITEFANFWERQTGQIDLEELKPSWLIYSKGFRVSWSLGFVKRVFDIAVAVSVLILTLPLTLVAAAAIKLESEGPLFYRQERVGMNGKLFKIWKFRTMRTDAEVDGVARWARANDDRVTGVGRFLRRARIDEIPQVVNVLLGSMSFVGPRPERPIFVEALTRTISHYDLRHRIKPGITGWAQINYPYGASDEDAKAKLAYDLYYAKNGGLFLDAVILFQTASVVLWPVGVR